MDKRKLNRITAVFLTLLVLVVAFMLSGSFRRTSRVVLPQESQQDEQISGFPGDSTDVLTVVAVAPDTVQAAIETLARPEQYRQTVSVQQFWSGGNGTSETTAAVLTPWSRLDRQLADGRQRHARQAEDHPGMAAQGKAHEIHRGIAVVDCAVKVVYVDEHVRSPFLRCCP